MFVDCEIVPIELTLSKLNSLYRMNSCSGSYRMNCSISPKFEHRNVSEQTEVGIPNSTKQYFAEPHKK